jgi:hypothetical protein
MPLKIVVQGSFDEGLCRIRTSSNERLRMKCRMLNVFVNLCENKYDIDSILAAIKVSLEICSIIYTEYNLFGLQ